MEISSYEHGQPSWVDVGEPDPAAAAEFYGAVFGWAAEAGPPEAGGYRTAQLRGRPVAGIGPQQSPGPAYWTTYINVDNAADIAAKVKELGGKVLVEPMAVLDVGTMAMFTDTIGAAFAVWQPGEHLGAGLVNEPGTFSWSELVTTDVEASKAFYSALFGWVPTDQGGPMQYTEWQLGSRSIGGMMPKPPMMPAEVPPHWAVYFAVAEADATVAKVTSLGGSVLMPAMDVEPGRIAVVADPAGAAFSLIQMRPGLVD